uniref:ABC transmembrane type-1 domain-containing protein n=1 Tax=Ascaris lumbricoides TaxID=6252 RepID=A0A9J2PXE5_ASCLU
MKQHSLNAVIVAKLCMCYSFGSVPFSLFVFGLEMHYSACPWLDDFYRHEILRRDFKAVEPYFDTQCGISGWALAAIFSLLSCGLFVSEGLISAFFRADSLRSSRKARTILVGLLRGRINGMQLKGIMKNNTKKEKTSEVDGPKQYEVETCRNKELQKSFFESAKKYDVHDVPGHTAVLSGGTKTNPSQV